VNDRSRSGDQRSRGSCKAAATVAGGIDFSHWTLVMQGPKANYTLFGDLVTLK